MASLGTLSPVPKSHIINVVQAGPRGTLIDAGMRAGSTPAAAKTFCGRKHVDSDDRSDEFARQCGAIGEKLGRCALEKRFRSFGSGYGEQRGAAPRTMNPRLALPINERRAT